MRLPPAASPVTKIAARALPWVILIAAAVACAQAVAIRLAYPSGDWQNYANAWNRVAHGLPLYAPLQLAGSYSLLQTTLEGYSYPPASVVLFAPFASYPAGLVAWTTVDIGMLLTGLWAIVSRAWPVHRLVVFGVVLAVLSVFAPFLDGARDENINLMIAGGFAWAWVGGSTAVAIAGAFGAITKLSPAGILVLLSGKDRSRWAVAVALVLVAVLVTLPIVGLNSWFDYVRALGNAVPTCYPGNFSIACALPDPESGRAVGILVAATCLLGALALESRFGRLCLAVAAYLAATFDLHPHSWTVLIVLVVIGASRFWPNRAAASNIGQLEGHGEPLPI